ncbi:D-alanine--D-alanine ligase [uncultured Desulfobacterium sp.]|uniref:D-alanine--D-alanine ligase n=1 Tax=uncultured Desulfobacterium sp. TaxID=201089 RepID=A0A445MZP4_9BACT|nr:D-alanine--D-alanine ligase [uncultured Desulfobacterium sp.]
MAKVKVAILAGGWSSESGVSTKSGKAAYHALDREKYDVTMYDPKYDLDKIIANKDRIDVAFILLHGRYGEDGRIQGLLDILGIPFVGSGVLASAMAVNKRVAKMIYRAEGLKVARDMFITRKGDMSLDSLADNIVDTLGPNAVLKPVEEGSSIGMSVCSNREEILDGLKKAFDYGKEIMVEEYIKGTEITCCVIGNQELETLPLIEIVPKSQYRFFDYEAKYKAGATDEICPARIEKGLEERAGAIALRAHTALGCNVWSRSDMIIRDNDIYLLETNTIPGMTETSLFPLAAGKAGVSFSELLDKLISLSITSFSIM